MRSHYAIVLAPGDFNGDRLRDARSKREKRDNYGFGLDLIGWERGGAILTIAGKVLAAGAGLEALVGGAIIDALHAQAAPMSASPSPARGQPSVSWLNARDRAASPRRTKQTFVTRP